MTVIVLDNDETTGYYSHLMTYMNHVAKCIAITTDHEAEIIDTITTIAKTNGIFRPGTEAFLRSIAERKRLGIVSSVVMYTNAHANPDMSWHSKSWGVVDWPHFLARVLSHMAGDPALFDIVLSRPPHLVHVAYPKKHFARVIDALSSAGRPIGDTERVIFFDDKPGEILGASERFIAWHAPEYKVPVTLEQINRALEILRLDVSETHWKEKYTPAMIRKQIYAMYTECKDALIPPPIVHADSAWCGFDIDAHLPLPPPPPAPVPPALVVQSESESDATPRRIRLHIELVLNISVGRRHKKKWRGSQHSNRNHLNHSIHKHYGKHKKQRY